MAFFIAGDGEWFFKTLTFSSRENYATLLISSTIPFTFFLLECAILYQSFRNYQSCVRIFHSLASICSAMISHCCTCRSKCRIQ